MPVVPIPPFSSWIILHVAIDISLFGLSHRIIFISIRLIASNFGVSLERIGELRTEGPGLGRKRSDAHEGCGHFDLIRILT